MATKKKAKPDIPVPTLDHLATLGREYQKLQQIRIAFGNSVWKLEQDGVTKERVEGMKALLEGMEDVEGAASSTMERAMLHHPFFKQFVATHTGIGAVSLAGLLGQIVSLDNFANVAKLWKYCGGAVVGSTGEAGSGHSPKRRRGERMERGSENSFNPKARTFCWRIADVAIRSKGPYRTVYDRARKAALARPRLGPSGCPFSAEPHQVYERAANLRGEQRKVGGKKLALCIREENGKLVSAHVHNHALRMVWKEVLKDLWVEWQQWKASAPA